LQFKRKIFLSGAAANDPGKNNVETVDASITIKVKCIDGSTAPVSMAANEDTTLTQVKERVEADLGIASSQQELYDSVSEDLLRDGDEAVQEIWQRCHGLEDPIDEEGTGRQRILQLTVVANPAVSCAFKSITQASGQFPDAKAGEFDNQGVLYFLGTAAGTQAYVNPHSSGTVLASMSSVEEDCSMYGRSDRFVSHQHGARIGNSTNVQMCASMAVDLGEGKSLVVNHYAIRHGAPTSKYGLRDWTFEGSHDGQNWTVLREHASDVSLPENVGFGVAAWPVKGVACAFRHFRIHQSSETPRALCCAGIELYGELMGAV
jgi:hypothetical protein